MKHTLKTAAVIAAATLVAACGVRQAEAVDPTRAGMRYAGTDSVRLYVDADTGCHYLLTANGVTPRLTAEGRPVCVL